MGTLLPPVEPLNHACTGNALHRYLWLPCGDPVGTLWVIEPWAYPVRVGVFSQGSCRAVLRLGVLPHACMLLKCAPLDYTQVCVSWLWHEDREDHDVDIVTIQKVQDPVIHLKVDEKQWKITQGSKRQVKWVWSPRAMSGLRLPDTPYAQKENHTPFFILFFCFGVPTWWLMLLVYSITVGFSPKWFCWPYVITLGNPFNTML